MLNIVLFAFLIFTSGIFHFNQKKMEAKAELKIMTFNIRYATPNDGINKWAHRKENVAALISYYHPHIFGIQEALLSQIQYLGKTLPQYNWVGSGRDDGKLTGEFSPVFYDTTRFRLMDSGTFWLSEHPETPGKSWDAALPRICTWVKLKDKVSESELFFYNTHYDHRGESARINSSSLIVNRINETGDDYPVILVGDFNFTPDSEGYSIITSVLQDTHIHSEKDHYGPEGTFSGFSLNDSIERRIDYIFINSTFICTRHRTITDHYGGFYASDHLPVIADIYIREKK